MNPSVIMPRANAVPRGPYAVIDLLKGLAAQLIVLHHLAWYGPMADHVRPVLPNLINWAENHARIAVQVFLVIGGFLAARSLCPRVGGAVGLINPVNPINPLNAILRRYLKLAPPFFVAMLLAVGASAWAGRWMTHASISPPPDGLQMLAHALLLHGVLGYESLSAGAWYVAIDFQLYALLSCLVWVIHRLSGKLEASWLAPFAIAAVASLSLMVFNRSASWDNWAPYFFGSYGLGVMAWWASDTARSRAYAACLFALLVLPAVTALLIDFRIRIAVALVVAVGLALGGRSQRLDGWVPRRLVRGMGNISFSVFLVHFPVCLVVNAAFTRFAPAQAGWQATGILLAWTASVVAGAVFYRWVEMPLGHLLTPARLPRWRRSAA